MEDNVHKHPTWADQAELGSDQQVVMERLRISGPLLLVDPASVRDEPSESRQALIHALLAASFLHLVALVLLDSAVWPQAGPSMADFPTLVIRVSNPIAEPPATQDQSEQSSVVAKRNEVHEVSDPQRSVLPAAARRSEDSPSHSPPPQFQSTRSSPAQRGVLQQYLNSGELPESLTHTQTEIDLGHDEDAAQVAIFNPLLRKRFKSAQALHRQVPSLSQQSYSLSSGDHFERQGGKCFVGRNIVSESGATRVWYPTACPQVDDSTNRAFRRSFILGD